MKKYILFVLIITVLFLSSCDSDFSLPQQPKITSQEEIRSTAIVVSYNEDHWYAASAHNYKFSVYVQCDEYGISKTFTDQTRGMWATSELKGLKKGDVIDVVVRKITYDDTSTRYEIAEIIK